MRHLLSKDVEFRWTEECQQELNYLKECLTADPILQPINPDKDLVIMTDTSGKEGFGWELLQMGDDNQLHAVAYGGQALTPSQRRWTRRS